MRWGCACSQRNQRKTSLRRRGCLVPRSTTRLQWVRGERLSGGVKLFQILTKGEHYFNKRRMMAKCSKPKKKKKKKPHNPKTKTPQPKKPKNEMWQSTAFQGFVQGTPCHWGQRKAERGSGLGSLSGFMMDPIECWLQRIIHKGGGLTRVISWVSAGVAFEPFEAQGKIWVQERRHVLPREAVLARRRLRHGPRVVPPSDFTSQGLACAIGPSLRSSSSSSSSLRLRGSRPLDGDGLEVMPLVKVQGVIVPWHDDSFGQVDHVLED